MARKVRLVDVTRCVGCKSCQVACKNWNQLPAAQTEFTGSYENPPDLLPECWSRVRFNEYAEGDTIKWYFTFISCMHCSDPACLSICPSNAISQTELKTIRIDPKICIGCGLCKNSCPFNVPRIGQITDKPLSWKCTSCFDRINNGYTTACSKACPTGALSFGDLDEKIAEAEAKVAVLQEKGYANARIYGKDEMGGLGVIYVLADSPEKYGLPENPQLSLGSYIWNIALRPVKFLATVGITVGVINNMINNKAIKAEKKEEQEIN